MKPSKILYYSLLAGVVYFFGVAIVHLLGFKIAGFYIYYNVPSTRYQDQIISFLAFGWAMFFLSVSQNLKMMPYLLLAGLVAVLALININLSNDFSAIANKSSLPYWVQTIVLAIYAAWLFFFTIKANNSSNA